MKRRTKTKPTDFDPSPAVLRKASALARGYTVVIEPDDDGGYVGHARELPGVIGGGDTIEACARDLHFALETAIAAYLDGGKAPPPPIARERRSEQVNVRLTPSEKDVLAQESTRRGFRGVADFIRAQMVEALDAGNSPRTAR